MATVSAATLSIKDALARIIDRRDLAADEMAAHNEVDDAISRTLQRKKLPAPARREFSRRT